MKVYIVRHTAVDVPKGYVYGQTNVPLKETFEQEAKIVESKLKDIKPDAVFTSPLGRCRKLAKYCGFNNAQYVDQLKEIFHGDWEMRHLDDLEGITEWQADKANVKMPNGESFQDVFNRVSSFFDELKTKDYNTVIIFAHGGVINCTRAYFGKTTIEHAFDDMVDYGGILEFTL